MLLLPILPPLLGLLILLIGLLLLLVVRRLLLLISLQGLLLLIRSARHVLDQTRDLSSQITCCISKTRKPAVEYYSPWLDTDYRARGDDGLLSCFISSHGILLLVYPYAITTYVSLDQTKSFVHTS
jgi:hypothetical protein